MSDELLSLIKSGRLPVGTVLTHKGRTYSGETAAVVESGLRVRTSVHSTPSAAARAITRAPVDGWGFWRLPDGSRLDTLRQASRQVKWVSPSQIARG